MGGVGLAAPQGNAAAQEVILAADMVVPSAVVVGRGLVEVEEAVRLVDLTEKEEAVVEPVVALAHRTLVAAVVGRFEHHNFRKNWLQLLVRDHSYRIACRYLVIP